MTQIVLSDYDSLFQKCKGFREEERKGTIVSFWKVGKEIEDYHAKNKVHGDETMMRLANDLGVSTATLYNARKFYRENLQFSNMLENWGDKNVHEATKFLYPGEKTGKKPKKLVFRHDISSFIERAGDISQEEVNEIEKHIDEIKDDFLIKEAEEELNAIKKPLLRAAHLIINHKSAPELQRKSIEEEEKLVKKLGDCEKRIAELEAEKTTRLTDIEVRREVIPEETGRGLKALMDENDWCKKELKKKEDQLRVVWKEREELKILLEKFEIRKYSYSVVKDVICSAFKDAKTVTMLDILNVTEARK